MWDLNLVIFHTPFPDASRFSVWSSMSGRSDRGSPRIVVPNLEKSSSTWTLLTAGGRARERGKRKSLATVHPWHRISFVVVRSYCSKTCESFWEVYGRNDRRYSFVVLNTEHICSAGCIIIIKCGCISGNKRRSLIQSCFEHNQNWKLIPEACPYSMHFLSRLLVHAHHPKLCQQQISSVIPTVPNSRTHGIMLTTMDNWRGWPPDFHWRPSGWR